MIRFLVTKWHSVLAKENGIESTIYTNFTASMNGEFTEAKVARGIGQL